MTVTLTLSWGAEPSAQTWSLSLPGTAALTECVPALAGVRVPEPARIKRALEVFAPILVLGAEAAGAGAPELFLVVAAVAAAKHLLSQVCPAGQLTLCADGHQVRPWIDV
jgi:hypothetical protein